MDTEYIDIRSLSIINDSISEITGLSLSIYDSNGNLLIPSKKQDESPHEEHRRFICNCLEKAMPRQESVVVKDLSGKNHLLIPFSFNGTNFAAISSAFSLEHSQLQNTAIHIKKILETLIAAGYEKNLDRKRYQWAKAITNIASDIHMPADMKEVFSSMLDALIFLFDAKTASIMIKDKDLFRAAAAAGSLKDEVRNLAFHGKHSLIMRSIEARMPASTNDYLEISRLGLPDSVSALHIFPLMDKDNVYGLLTVYNSMIQKDVACGILDFCKLICIVIKNLYVQNDYDRCINDLMALHMATKKVAQINERDDIYEAIVDAATELLNAEKGSLMLPNRDDLVIKAVRGINKWLVQDIRIKIGEGVAGKVFKDGKPFFVKNAETLKPDIKQRHHYKTNSFISMPLTFASEITGVLNVTDKTTGDEFTEKDLSLLNYFSSYASIVLKANDHQAMAEQMKEFAITDYLTGLFNRRYLYEHLTEEIHRSERYGFIFSFVILDIDNFKLFNDTEGHIAGDNILKEFARISRECLRANDILCRFGGEEFAILMPQTGSEEAYGVAERIRKNIKDHLLHKVQKFPHPYITASFGISSFPECGTNIDELIKSADSALYEAKAKGKDTIVVCRKN